jgi:hypothetical protein
MPVFWDLFSFLLSGFGVFRMHHLERGAKAEYVSIHKE